MAQPTSEMTDQQHQQLEKFVDQPASEMTEEQQDWDIGKDIGEASTSMINFGTAIFEEATRSWAKQANAYHKELTDLEPPRSSIQDGQLIANNDLRATLGASASALHSGKLLPLGAEMIAGLKKMEELTSVKSIFSRSAISSLRKVTISAWEPTTKPFGFDRRLFLVTFSSTGT